MVPWSGSRLLDCREEVGPGKQLAENLWAEWLRRANRGALFVTRLSYYDVEADELPRFVFLDELQPK
jgi:hypothetical protein